MYYQSIKMEFIISTIKINSEKELLFHQNQKQKKGQ